VTESDPGGAAMRRVQNGLVILASFLAAGSLLRWNSRLRVACAAGVVAIVVILVIMQLRARGSHRRNTADVESRVARIRAERAARMGRRRRL
jgi:hypothetical protein